MNKAWEEEADLFFEDDEDEQLEENSLREEEGDIARFSIMHEDRIRQRSER